MLVAGGLQEPMHLEYPEEPQEEEEFKDAIVEAAPTPDRPDDYIDEDQLKKLELDYTPEHKQKLKEEAEDLKLKGNEYFRLGEYKESALKYTDALRMCPTGFTKDRAILYANRAATKMKMELNESAIEDCSKAIECDGDYVKALMRRAQLYEKTEKLDEALEDYKKVLELDPSNKKAHHALQKLKEKAEDLKLKGNEYFRLAEYKESALKYTEALRMCPTGFAKDRAVLYANRAAAKMKMELNESAIEDCSKAIECDGDYVKALMRRAQLYEKTEKLDKALKDYNKVLELDPSNKEAHHASQMDILGQLPVEITEEILSYLTPKELFCCFRVSKRWRALVNNDHLWSSKLPYAACFPSASDFTECDIVGIEVCPTMRKWLADLVAMKRWRDFKPKETVFRERDKYFPHTMLACHYLNPRFVWMPSPCRSGPGDIVRLDYMMPYRFWDRVSESFLIGSEDGRFLASTVDNIIFLYSRHTSTSLDFHLLVVLAYHGWESSRNEVPEDMQGVISIWKKEPSGKSLEEFLIEQHLRGSRDIECEGVAATDNDRIISLYDPELQYLLIWNVSTSRVTSYLRTCDVRKVEVGWNGRGLCVTLNDRVVCYNSKGRPVDTFFFPDYSDHKDTLLMRSVSMVFVAVTIFDLDGFSGKLMLMEFERGRSSGRVGFEVEEFIVLSSVRLLGGAAYPVVLVSPVDTLHVYIGSVSPRGVCKWHKNRIEYCLDRQFPDIRETLQRMHIVQFVDGTSYLLPYNDSILKVIMRKRKGSNELIPVLTVEKHAASRLSLHYQLVWADSTRLALQDEGILIIQTFI